MGADIHSFLEIKDSRTKRWVVVGKNLTVEHFNLEKEAPDLKINFSMGDMSYDWRDITEFWQEWLSELKQRKKLPGSHQSRACAKNHLRKNRTPRIQSFPSRT